MLPSRGGVGCSRISESGLLGTRNRPIQPTTRTAMNYKISTKSSYCTCKTIVRVSRSAYPLGPLYPPGLVSAFPRPCTDPPATALSPWLSRIR